MDLAIKWTMNGISRRFEFEADHFARGLGHAAELSRALIKLQIKNLSTMDADKWYARYNFSHPHLTERLGRLGWKPDASEKPVSEDLEERLKEKAAREKAGDDDKATTTGRDEL
jgi:STE24 endopeptidase